MGKQTRPMTAVQPQPKKLARTFLAVRLVSLIMRDQRSRASGPEQAAEPGRRVHGAALEVPERVQQVQLCQRQKNRQRLRHVRLAQDVERAIPKWKHTPKPGAVVVPHVTPHVPRHSATAKEQ